jgi:hypothetical protein
MKLKWFHPVVFVIAAFLTWRLTRPLNIFVIDEKFERPIHLAIPEGLNSLGAEECGGCHSRIYQEWAESMHAKAWTDPYYQVDLAYDGSLQICLNCHIPLEDQQENLVLGFRDRDKFHPILRPNPEFDPKLRDEGVTCAVCHVRDGHILGPFGTDSAPHPVIADPGMSSGLKYCERCHVVSGKRWDTFYDIPPCGTVAEITGSMEEPDCVGCHMPETVRPLAGGTEARAGRQHLFRGGHDPETVRQALKVEHTGGCQGAAGDCTFIFTLMNIGAAHYLPTGTPDRHLTLELRLFDKGGNEIGTKIFTMKRHILWRPFIVDIWDTRLPYGVPRRYDFSFGMGEENPPSVLDVTVTYHLLDQKRRRKIGYENTDPIAYPIYKARIGL